MNEKSQPLAQAPTINSWLKYAYDKLNLAQIPSAKLDAEIILSRAINEDKTYLIAHPDHLITEGQLTLANQYLDRRIKREPIAYIFGYKEFYGRIFFVNRATLIPRPESEQIIESLSGIINHSSNLTVIDVGTGSGCLGITAKLKFSNLHVILTDISEQAIEIANKNATNLNADVKIIRSDLLDNITQKADIILANLPYVNREWERSPETDFEPSLALFANDNGEELIKKLIKQASSKLHTHGHIIIEADPSQHGSLVNYAKKYSFALYSKNDYIIDLILNNTGIDTVKTNK